MLPDSSKYVNGNSNSDLSEEPDGIANEGPALTSTKLHSPEMRQTSPISSISDDAFAQPKHKVIDII